MDLFNFWFVLFGVLIFFNSVSLCVGFAIRSFTASIAFRGERLCMTWLLVFSCVFFLSFLNPIRCWTHRRRSCDCKCRIGIARSREGRTTCSNCGAPSWRNGLIGTHLKSHRNLSWNNCAFGIATITWRGRPIRCTRQGWYVTNQSIAIDSLIASNQFIWWHQFGCREFHQC